MDFSPADTRSHPSSSQPPAGRAEARHSSSAKIRSSPLTSSTTTELIGGIELSGGIGSTGYRSCPVIK